MNIIIHDLETFNKTKKIFLKKINVFSNVNDFKRFNKKKFDYTMIGIIGFFGLQPTLDIIEVTKKIAIANKVHNLWMEPIQKS